MWRRNTLTSLSVSQLEPAHDGLLCFEVFQIKYLEYSFSYCSCWLTDVWVCLCRDFTQFFQIGLKTATLSWPCANKMYLFHFWLYAIFAKSDHFKMLFLQDPSCPWSLPPLLHLRSPTVSLQALNKRWIGTGSNEQSWWWWSWEVICVQLSAMWNPLWSFLTEANLWCRRVDVIIVMQNETGVHNVLRKAHS